MIKKWLRYLKLALLTQKLSIINFQSLFTSHQEEILRILNYPKKSMGQENQLEKLEAAKAA